MTSSTVTAIRKKCLQLFFPKRALLHAVEELHLSHVDSLYTESVFWSHNLRIEEIRSVTISKSRYHDGVEFRDKLVNLLANLFVQKEIAQTTVGLSQLSGFCGSKSVDSWKDLSEFATYIQTNYKVNSACDIKCVTAQDFDVCVQHSFPERHGPFKIKYCAWDDKYFWENNDGSHHLGAAFGYAKRANVDHRIPANLICWTLDECRAHIFKEKFIGLIVNPECDDLINMLKKYEVPFEFSAFVPPFYNYKVLFILKNKKWSRTVTQMSNALCAKGMVHDFGKLIMELVQKQKSHVKSTHTIM